MRCKGNTKTDCLECDNNAFRELLEGECKCKKRSDWKKSYFDESK